MPGLIASFFRPLRRTTHKSHVPDITGWGRFLMKTRFGFVAVFVIILPLAIWCSSRTEYAFNDAGIDELKYSESRAAARKITGTFANDTTIAMLVPSGNYEAEKQFLARRRGARQCEDRHRACEYRDRGRESVDGFLYAAHVLHAVEHRF